VSAWTRQELRGVRRHLKAALTHINRALASSTPQIVELTAIRRELWRDLARVNRALDIEHEQQSQRRSA